MSEKMTTAENPQEDKDRLKLDDQQKKDLVEAVMESWETADGARSKWMKDKEAGLNLYWGIRSAKTFPFENCANLHVPLIRTISDTLHSNIMGSIDPDMPVTAMPVGPEDVPKARKIEKLLNWQATVQFDYVDTVDKIAQSCLIYGIAPVKVRYVIEKDGEKKKFDGIKVDVLPPERFLTPPDSASSDVDEMEYVIQEVPLTKSDIKKRILSKTYDKLTDEELDAVGKDTSNGRDGEDMLEHVREFYSGVDGEEQKSTSKHATVIECYLNYDYNNDGIDESIMVSVLKESRKVLRAVKWDRPRPFVIVKFSDILNKAVGESIPDLLMSINEEINTLHNQDTDATTFENVPFFFFDPVAGFNPGETKLTPGLGIPVNGSPSQAVYFPAFNRTRPNMQSREEALFLYAERMLGAGANVQGVLQTKRVTATEIAAVDRRSGIRFLTIFNRIRKGIRQMFKLILALDQEYMPKEIQVRITGMDSQKPIFERFTREDATAQVDIVIRGNSILDQQAEKTEQMQLYTIGMQNPLIARDSNAVYELTRDLYAKLGAKRIDAYLRKPQDEIPRTPEEEHNLFMQEEDADPHLAENIEDHLNKHAAIINSDQFKLFSPTGRMKMMKHYADTVRMKSTLEAWQKVNELAKVNSMLLQSQMTGSIPGMGQPAGAPVRETPLGPA